MLSCQKTKFALPENIHYLNCATRGPLSKLVEEAGIQAIQHTTSRIHQLTPHDFFDPVDDVRQLFCQLIGANDPERVALVPSVSYALSTVARNLARKTGIKSGQTILLPEGEFPSDVYAWERPAADIGLHIKTIPMPAQNVKGPAWNESILSAIDEQTAVVVCPHVHWMYGIKFDLEAIAVRAREVGAWLIVDGTQSVGALPFDYECIRPDLLVCAAYKWLMGPYSLGLAYFGEAFDGGIPLEESWMARQDSHHFHNLTEYQPDYRPKAYRYNMGEQSNFVQLPMLKAALRQLLDWQPASIQAYCRELFREALPQLQEKGFVTEPEPYRAHHLLGIRLPEDRSVLETQKALAQNRIYVSARGQGIRVSPQIYNTPEDVHALFAALVDI